MAMINNKSAKELELYLHLAGLELVHARLGIRGSYLLGKIDLLQSEVEVAPLLMPDAHSPAAHDPHIFLHLPLRYVDFGNLELFRYHTVAYVGQVACILLTTKVVGRARMGYSISWIYTKSLSIVDIWTLLVRHSSKTVVMRLGLGYRTTGKMAESP